jgi:uncharacterized protein
MEYDRESSSRQALVQSNYLCHGMRLPFFSHDFFFSAFCHDCVSDLRIMFSLQQFLGKDQKFYDLLEASSAQVSACGRSLAELLQRPPDKRSLDDFIQSRRKDKRITEEINQALCKTFVTPLEREDIEALSTALYKIPKTIEKFGEHFLLCQKQVNGEVFNAQLKLIEQATATVHQLVAGLRHKRSLEVAREQNDRLQYLEGEADKLMLRLLQDLYSGQHDALKVVILRGLYELLEKVVDRCRDAGNIVFHIILKYS